MEKIEIYDWTKDIGNARQVYAHLQDEESRHIYECRAMYALTGESSFLHKIFEYYPQWHEIIGKLHSGAKNFLFGAGICGRRMLAATPGCWQGILDNNKSLWGKSVAGLPVFAPDEVRRWPDAQIFLAIHTPGNPAPREEVMKQLRELGVEEDRIVRVDEFLDSMGEQYFGLKELTPKSGESFVDGGAYDGLTALSFAKWAGDDFGRIICFEPDGANQELCRQRLASFPSGKAELVPKGLWSKSATLHFDSQGNQGSSLVDTGDASVEVTSLDEELCGQKVSFIKMDVEGAELAALKGAQKIILEQHPKLAICVYHKPEDIFEIPQLLLSYHDDYCFFLRQYALSGAETVLYAL
ncbi:MAG: FkbM family methyltransferase [Selenomonas ruminantium]|nr:FkbM family methyltransferase [Selenomonas ruminantium]